MSFYLGIDLGTSYFKAGIYNGAGSQCGLGREFVPKLTADGRCELPLEKFWEVLSNAVSQAVADAGIAASDIDAVSYSSQANSFVLLDSEGEPLTPLVLWPDARAAAGCEALQRLSSRPDYLDKTGIGVTPDGEWMAAKLCWFQNNEPGLWNRTASVMTISDYLVYALTGCKASDFSTASMTSLLDVSKGCWWTEALDILGIKEQMLSRLFPSGTFVGPVTAAGAALSGISEGTELYLGCLDHHAVAIGAGILEGHRISESTGTVLACAGYSDTYAPCSGVITSPGLDDKHFFRMAFDSNGATAVEWYQKHYAPELNILQLEDEARNVPAGCDGLEAKPRSDTYPGLDGFIGVKPEHTRAHFLRAIFESTARTLTQLVDALDPDRQATVVIPSGGGARNTLWLQIKEDMLQRKYLPQASGELATKGAATLASHNYGIDKEREPRARRAMGKSLPRGKGFRDGDTL